MFKHIVFVLAIILINHICAQPPTQSTVPGKYKYTISGYVKDAKSKELLIGVTVYIPGIKDGVVTNAYGFYSITLPASDSAIIIYSYVGYSPVTKQIKLDKDVTLSVDLAQASDLQEVEVVADKVERASKQTNMSIIDIPVHQIKNIPALMGEKDVLKVLQLMPGVQKSSEGSAGFYVRGGGADQNLIILDDAPVYNAFHLFGFFSLFNGDALKNVTLVKGGFPARYGGRLSSVVDMTMKDGDKQKFHGEGGIGILSSRLTLQGPIIKDKSSFLISARRTYIDVLMQPFIMSNSGGSNAGYFFYDLNAKLNYDINEKNRVYLSGYFGKDKFYFIERDPDFPSKAGLSWGNATATARWNHIYNTKLFSNTSFIFTDYKFLVSMDEGIKNDQYHLRYSSSIQDIGVKHDFDYYPHTKHYIKAGILFTNHTFSPNAFVVKSDFEPESNITRKAITNAIEGGAYIEDEYKVLPALRINPGLRFSCFSTQRRFYKYFEPRISVSYNLKEDVALKASYAQMNQYIQLVSNTGVGLPTDLWVPSTRSVVPQHSEQYAAGIAKSFFNIGWDLTFEGYYKKMNNIMTYKEGASFLDVGESIDPTTNTATFEKNAWEKKIVQGKGWSYGAEILFQRKKGKFNGWVGYTLSWTQLKFDSINFGKPYFAKYDRRHDISLVGIYNIRDVSEDKKGISISATWVYGTGNAITLPMSHYEAADPPSVANKGNSKFMDYYGITEFTAKNAFRMAAYHRMDVSIQITKKKKYYERTWEFSLYNAYNRKNPYFYYIDYSPRTRKTLLMQVSLFPILPSFSWNFKF